MNVALLLLLYTYFVIYIYQILPCVNYICTVACWPTGAEHHITSSSLVMYLFTSCHCTS